MLGGSPTSEESRRYAPPRGHPADFSGDPGDRLIAATALAERIAVVTNDLRIPSLQVDQDYLVSAGRKSSSERTLLLPRPPVRAKDLQARTPARLN
jgi:hypothetical protein